MNKRQKNGPSRMGLGKTILLALLIGIGISAIGVALMTLGGWGPCGPASAIATIGGCLNMIHVAWLLALFPSLDGIAGRLHADWVLVFVWPAIVWSVLSFIALKLRKGSPWRRILFR